MSTREQLILYVCVAIFLLVVFIAVLLIHRREAPDTKIVVDAVEAEGVKTRAAIEGARGQIDVLEGTVKPELGYIRATLNNFMDRFGFLKGPRP